MDSLQDPHCQLLLLRASLGSPKIQYSLRTAPPGRISSSIEKFDWAARAALENILGFGGQGFGDLHWRLAGLPCRLGGLGVLHASDLSQFSFLTSLSKSSRMQDSILSQAGGPVPLVADTAQAVDLLREVLPPSHIPFSPSEASSIHGTYYQSSADRLRMEAASDPRFSLVFSLSQRPHATDIWQALPIARLGLTLDPFPYRLALRYRLGLPVFPYSFPCPRCGEASVDPFGDHALHCRVLPGYKQRHDHVRDVLVSLFRQAGVTVVKEADVSFVAPGVLPLRLMKPADLLLPGWTHGRSTCVDVTGVSPFTRSSGGQWSGHAAMGRAVQKKLAKHLQGCTEGGFAFLPFAFS